MTYKLWRCILWVVWRVFQGVGAIVDDSKNVRVNSIINYIEIMRVPSASSSSSFEFFSGFKASMLYSVATFRGVNPFIITFQV